MAKREDHSKIIKERSDLPAARQHADKANAGAAAATKGKSNGK